MPKKYEVAEVRVMSDGPEIVGYIVISRDALFLPDWPSVRGETRTDYIYDTPEAAKDSSGLFEEVI